MSGNRRSAPATAWLLALLMILPVALPLVVPAEYQKHYFLETRDELHRRDLTGFLEAPRSGDDAPRGVLLAMSGVGCAAIGLPRLSANGVDLYMAVYNEATIHHYRSLVNDLVAGGADFIVIQDTVLIQTRAGYPIRERYRQARSYWRSQILRGLAVHTGRQYAEAGAVGHWECTGWPAERSQWVAEVRNGMDRIFAHLQRQQDDVVDFIANFSAADIPVMIVSPPTNTFTIEYTSLIHDSARAMLSGEASMPGVSFHRQEALMPDALFPDPFHLSPEKNQPYRDWLNEEIMRVMKDRSNR